MSSQEHKSIDWRKLLSICFMMVTESICFNFVNINITYLLMLSGLDRVTAYSLVGCFFIISGILEFSSGIASNWIPVKWSYLTATILLTLDSLLLAVLCRGTRVVSPVLTMASILLAATGCAIIEANSYDLLFHNDNKGAFGKLDIILIRRFIVNISGLLAFILLQYLTATQGFLFLAGLNTLACSLHLLLGRELYPPIDRHLAPDKQELGVNLLNVVCVTAWPTVLLLMYYHPLTVLAYLAQLTLPVWRSLVATLTVGGVLYYLLPHCRAIHGVLAGGATLAVLALVTPALAALISQGFIFLSVSYLVYYFLRISKGQESERLARGLFWLFQLTFNIIFACVSKTVFAWFQAYHCTGFIGPLVVNPQSAEVVGRASSIIFIIASIIWPPKRVGPRQYNLYLTYSNMLNACNLLYLGAISLLPYTVSSLLALPFNILHTLNWFVFLRVNTRAVYFYFPNKLRKPLISLTSILTTTFMGVISTSAPARHILYNAHQRQLFTASFFVLGAIMLLSCGVLLLGQIFLDRENWEKRNLEIT